VSRSRAAALYAPGRAALICSMSIDCRFAEALPSH
jgi:hypothetical protein